MGSVASSVGVDTPRLYRPRNVRATPLYQLLEAYYDRGSEAVDHLDKIGAIKSRYSPDFDKPMGKPEYNAHVPENRVPFGRHLLSEGGIHTSGQGAFLIGGVREYLSKQDAKVLHSHAVKGLIRDAEGAVVGVEVTDPSGRVLRARARGRHRRIPA